MKPKSSIIRLSLIGVAIILGFVLAFCPIKIGLTEYSGFANTFKLGLDLKGGVYAVYETERNEIDDEYSVAMNNTIASVRKVLKNRGYSEFTLQKIGTDKLAIAVPKLDDSGSTEEFLQILGKPAEIEFVLGTSESAKDGTGEVVMTGKDHVESASAVATGNTYSVSLKFNETGKALFYKITSENAEQTLNIVSITGEERTVLSSPKINTPISDGIAMISGNFTENSAENLAQQIASAKFPLAMSMIEISETSASLGEKAVLSIIIAVVVALAVIIAIKVLLYGLFGAASSLSLLCYTVFSLFILSIFPWLQLTLPAVVGILLSLGIAIDGNIIICERVKDEYRAGKSILSASHYGFRKSIRAIMDSAIATVVAGLMLLVLGGGMFNGLAITMVIGVLFATVSTLVLTPRFFKHMVRLNDFNPKLFRLQRGKEFEHLGADQNDAVTELELKEKAQKKEAKHKKEEATAEGGV